VLVDLAERRHPVALMPSPPAGPAQIDLKGGTNSSSGNPTQSDPLQTQRPLRRVGRVSPAELTELDDVLRLHLAL
jgi:mRNA-degrading endonuclease toxin of MazEF toxin-antitoxin module